MVAAYEAATGRTLYPAQPEMLLINLIAYREMLVRTAIQEAAKQNLVEYAIFPMLDYLAELVGVTRLAAVPAKTTLRFFLTGAQGVTVTIPAGTRVESGDGLMVFATDSDLDIAIGATSGDAWASAETPGAIGNGYGIGTVKNLVVSVPYVNTVANQTTSAGGADEETDVRLRQRIKEAPEQWSNAGSKGAYKFFAKSAHASIIDVAVTTPSAGVVNVYPLLSTGNPDSTVIDLVTAALDDEKVRPLTDQVQVLAPTRITFTITASVTLFDWADTAAVQSQIDVALAQYEAELQATLGKDIVVSQIIATITGIYGVYKTVLTAPAADVVLAANEWADCTARTVTVAGYVNG